jgi:phage baseplate assembly protein W
MSDLGKTIDQLKLQGVWKEKTISPDKMPIGIKTPLEKGSSHGETLFKMHFSIADQIQDNLKNLIMTQRGERLGFPDFGTRLRAIYSNTSITEDQVAEHAADEISKAVAKYMPSLKLIQFYSEIVDSSEQNVDVSNRLGQDFSNIQQNVNIENSDIVDINKNNPKLDSVYKITIEYSIPILNDTRTIKLFVNNSK